MTENMPCYLYRNINVYLKPTQEILMSIAFILLPPFILVSSNLITTPLMVIPGCREVIILYSCSKCFYTFYCQEMKSKASIDPMFQINSSFYALLPAVQLYQIIHNSLNPTSCSHFSFSGHSVNSTWTFIFQLNITSLILQDKDQIVFLLWSPL